MESAEFITRKIDDKVHGQEIISLTSRGKEIQQQTSKIQQQVSCDTGLTEQEYTDLKDRLESMLQNFKLDLKRKQLDLAASLATRFKQPKTTRHVKALYTSKHGNSN